MPLPYGSYLVFGQHGAASAAPQVHLIGTEGAESFRAHLSFASGRRDVEAGIREAFRQAFNMPDADTAVPAWSQEAMLLIAQEYSGNHEIAVKGIAAAIALGRPFGDDARKSPPTDAEGGQKVPNPKPPKAPKGGGFAALTTGVPQS